MSEEFALKYGDKIILRCIQDSKTYFILARSPQDQQVFVLESQVKQPKDAGYCFSLYNTPQQMIFQVYPKLLYEASKRYSKLQESQQSASNNTAKFIDENVRVTQEIQKSLLKRRMETERVSNQSLVMQYKGQSVKYGDQIMLFHPLTKSFFKSTNKSISRQSEFSRHYMYCLSRQLNANMYFTISPDPLALEQKSQGIVRTYDQFLLVSYKMETIMKFNHLSTLITHPPHKKTNKNLDHTDGYLSLPLILENHYLFKCYTAYHKLYEHDSLEDKSSNSLGIYVLDPKEHNYLWYGQYVRIKYFKAEKKLLAQISRKQQKEELLQQQQLQKGYLSCSINSVGLQPSVLFQLQHSSKEDYSERAAQVFQIVPDNDSLYGQPVMLSVKQQLGFVQFNLRHLLSGKFLKISHQKRLIVSNDYVDSLKLEVNSMQVGSPGPMGKSLMVDPKLTYKNLPHMRLYRSLMEPEMEQLNLSPDLLLQTQQLSKTTQKPLDTEGNQNDDRFLFVMKLGSSQSTNSKEKTPFPLNNSFCMGSGDARLVIEVDCNEEVAAQEKLKIKDSKFQGYSPEDIKKIIRDEYNLLLPLLEPTQKKFKTQINESERNIISFIEQEENAIGERRMKTGHFKENDYTFMYTFVTFNPLKMSFYDIRAGEDYLGSNFYFESVIDQDIKEYNDVTTLLAPIYILSKHPLYFSVVKYSNQFKNKIEILLNKNIKKKDDTLTDQVLDAQRRSLQLFQDVNKSLSKLLLWLCDSEEEDSENALIDPIPRRQVIFRELGVIDLVIKILYELFIHGWLQKDKDDHVLDMDNFSGRLHEFKELESEDLVFSQEIDQLTACISVFLQCVSKNSLDNSIYVFQWYFLYKQILLEGKLTETLRLDLLMMQLFQQTDINVTFHHEVANLINDARVDRYNKNAYNLLIAFCLYSSFREKEKLNTLFEDIFVQNIETLFSQFSYSSEGKSIQIKTFFSQEFKDITVPLSEMLTPRTPFIMEGTEFRTRGEVSDFMISCVRLIGELAKSNPSGAVKYCKDIFPFETCVAIIQDLRLPAQTRAQMMEFFKLTYMKHDLKDLRELTFPQFIKFKNKVGENKFMDIYGAEAAPTTVLSHHFFSQRKIFEIYKAQQQKYLSLDQGSLDLWSFVSNYMKDIYLNKRMNDIRSAEHLYIQQLFRAFYLLLQKGLFITIFQQDKNTFTSMYDQFWRLLQAAVDSTYESNKQITKNSKRDEIMSPDKLNTIVRMTELEDDHQQHKNGRNEHRSSTIRSAVWIDELIEIINLLEQIKQNMMIDEFVQDSKTDKIFDEFSFVEAHKPKNKHKLINKLKALKRNSSHTMVRGRNEYPPVDKNVASNQEIIQMMSKLSKNKKAMILEQASKITSPDLFDHLAQLLTFHTTRVSASIVELLSTIFSGRSQFLYTINNLCVLDSREHAFMLNRDKNNEEEQQKLIDEKQQQSIYTEFTSVYWRIHFALNSLRGDAPEGSYYDQINDSLSDLLMIFYPDYAAKTDMQNYMELNQMENQERHHLAYEQPVVKSKTKQEQMVEQADNQNTQVRALKVEAEDYDPQQQMVSMERLVSVGNIDELKLNGISQTAKALHIQSPRFDDPNQSFNDSPSGNTMWRVNGSLTVDVLYIFYRQKILRFLGFHELIIGIFQHLIMDTGGNIFRDRRHQTDVKKLKQYEIMTEVIEKSVMFLLYFVLRNEENQELLLKASKRNPSLDAHLSQDSYYLQQLATVDNKSLQPLVYKLMSELFRDNYNILFNLEPYCDPQGVIGKMFKKFEYNFSEKNFEACISFLQFVPYLIKAKQNEILQNHELIVQIFKKSKLSFKDALMNLLKQAYEIKLDVNIHDGNGTIEMPTNMCFLIEFINLMIQLGSKSSPAIDEFTKALLPISLISDALQNLDEWFPLKLALVRFFQSVYLDNSVITGQEEKVEIEEFVLDSVLKQFDESFLSNQNLVRYRYQKVVLQNSVVFNILSARGFFCSSELLYKIDYEKAAYIYVVFGLVDLLGDFIRKVFPEILSLSQTEYEVFDNQSREDLLMVAPSVLDLIQQVRDYIFEHPDKSKNRGGISKHGTLSRQRSARSASRRIKVSDQELPLTLKDEDNRKNLQQSFFICKELLNSSISQRALSRQNLSERDKKIQTKWETIIAGSRRSLIESALISDTKNQEMQELINCIVKIKISEPQKFQKMISSMIALLSEETVAAETKLKSMTILRKLSNYKDDQEVTQSILKDLGELGFTDFLCQLICAEENTEQKLEYIKGFVEYLDDSSVEIQTSFYNFLMKDQNNKFLRSLQTFISDTFHEIKMLEKVNQDLKNHQQRSKLKRIINTKINSCIYVIELLRLSCENHFTLMQDFYRQGRPDDTSRSGVNMIVYMADLFEKYSKFMNELNAPLGEKMIEFLIETVQGPCNENQRELCQQTRILEVIEEVNLSLRLTSGKLQTFNQRDVLFSGLRQKIFLLQLSMMEGNTDEEIPKKISQFFNPQLLLERIDAVYHKAIRKISSIQLDQKTAIRKSRTGQDYGLLTTRETMQTLNTDQGIFEYVEEEILDDILLLKNPEASEQEPQQQATHRATTDQCEQMVKECYMIYILLRKLKKYVPQIREFSSSDPKIVKAVNYFKTHTNSIEIVNMHSQLEKVYFPVPSLMNYLSDETKQSFLEEVNRESINDKINGLLDEVDNFYLEMSYYMRLHQYGLRYNNSLIMLIRNICLLIAFVINILLMVQEVRNFDYVIFVLGIIEVVLYGFIFCVWILFRMNLEYKKISAAVYDQIALQYGRTRQVQAAIMKYLLIVQHMIGNSYTVYWSVLVALSLLGVFFSKMYYGFLLLDIIDHSIVLKNVIKSITLNYQQLLMTAVLGLCILQHTILIQSYLYAIVSHESVEFKRDLIDSSDDQLKVCDDLFLCFIYMLHMGMRAGGGVGDDLVQPNPRTDVRYFSQRVVYDLSYYIIINIIWMNIIFGIIIDTFAELRDEKKVRDYDSQNKCFICNLSRSTFEKEGVSFENHINKQHMVWSYTAFMVHLRVKIKSEHTGIESYINSKVEKGDISWLPIQKAIKLEQLGVEINE